MTPEEEYEYWADPEGNSERNIQRITEAVAAELQRRKDEASSHTESATA